MSEPIESRSISWLLGRIFHWLYPYRWTAILMVAAMLVDLAYDSIFPLALKILIDDAITPRNFTILISVLAGLVMLGLMSASSALVRDFLFAKLSSNVLSDLRMEMYRHMQRLSMSFYSRTQIGDIMARFSSDLSSVENTLVLALPSSIYALLGMIISGVMLFVIEWHIALLACVGIPLCLVGPKLIGPKAQRLGYEMKVKQAEIASTIQENVAAQPIVKAFGLERLFMDRFTAQIAEYLPISRKANFLAYLMERTPNIGLIGFNIMVIIAGAYMAYEGYLKIGSLVAFQGLFLNLSGSVYGLTSMLPHFVLATGGMQRIDELLGQQPEVSDPKDARTLALLERDIEFRNVTFSYRPDQKSLCDVSFTIPRGSYAAFVGASGSGKSTVLSLLLRFYDPQSGAVLIDGNDLRGTTQDSLRAQTGVVMQESFLFNTSVIENLRLSKPDATYEEIIAACRDAEIHDAIIALPNGYDTVAGERGQRLSGGQRQRVAIARALLRHPSILVLDEATSALDPKTEASVNETLSRVAKGRTVVTVTHRLSQVVNADRIFVMDQGSLVESGTHKELIAKRGVYCSMWEKQSGFSLTQGGDWAEIGPARLARIPVLGDLDKATLENVAKAFVTEQYPADRFVIHQGDPGDRFYIIVRGKVEVLRSNNGEEPEIIAVLHDGDHFGEIALLRNVPRTASIRTLTPCMMISLPRGQFANLVSYSTEMRGRLENLLSARMAVITSKYSPNPITYQEI
jgi:ATP-binding cassette, subfamily B, bacterial